MSIDLSPLGFRKTPFTRELTVAERCTLDYQAEAAEALTEAVRQRMSAALIAPPAPARRSPADAARQPGGGALPGPLRQGDRPVQA